MPYLISLRLLKISVFFVAAIYLVNFLFLGFLMSPHDYNHMAGYYEISWRYWRYAEGLPHFNPFLCGGRPLAADPQIPLFNPFTLFVPLLGAVWTIKIEQLFQLALGVWGLLKIMKLLSLQNEEKWWGILLFLSGGAVVSRFLVGHVAVGYLLFIPLILALSIELQVNRQFFRTFLLFCLVVLYAFLHKPNFLIYVVPTLLFETTIRSLLLKSPRPLLTMIAGLGVGVLPSLATSFTAFEYFSLYPRISDGIPNSTPWHTLFLNIIFPLKSIPDSLYGPNYFLRHEYSIFLGLVPCALALFGIIRIYRSQPSPTMRAVVSSFIAWTLFSLLLGMGTNSAELTLNPYTWLHNYWPGFHTIRAPMRFWSALYFALIIFSALGFRLTIPGPKKFWAAVTLIPLLANAGINLSKTSVKANGTQWRGGSSYQTQFVWVKSSPHDNYFPIKQGQGVIDCFYNMQIPQASLTLGPLLPLLPGAHLQWETWNRISIAWKNPTQSSLFFNINHAPYWRFEGTGARITSHDGEQLTLAPIEGQVNAPITGSLIYEIPHLKKLLQMSFGLVLIGILTILFRLVFRKMGFSN